MERHSSPERKREKLGSMSVLDNCALTPPLTPSSQRGGLVFGYGRGRCAVAQRSKN